jgi:hypothetical protein
MRNNQPITITIHRNCRAEEILRFSPGGILKEYYLPFTFSIRIIYENWLHLQ